MSKFAIKTVIDIGSLETDAEVANVCGGTVSSHKLKEALQAKKEFIERVDVVIEKWRLALRTHNLQETKYIEYNLETGNPVA